MKKNNKYVFNKKGAYLPELILPVILITSSFKMSAKMDKLCNSFVDISFRAGSLDLKIFYCN